ncbi:SDR family oxidoreductase [Deinococcus sp.]|uniref:SDR family oxidoreductase n=1 Tax=Deinococcus sp. TaxID=47478 RepID=UPI003C7A2A8B
MSAASQAAAPGRVAVAGVTGRIGRHVAEVLSAAGHQVVAMSRASGVNLLTGDGLAAALSGVTCIIDVADAGSADEREATAFFSASAHHLQAAGQRAGVRRIALVSIVGCDRFPSGYNAAKRAQELALLSGALPVRILRSAPFHEFVPQVMTWDRRGEVCFVPEMTTRLVAARTVAEALVKLALCPDPESATPAGTEPIWEIAGPQVVSVVDKARLYVARRGEPLRIEVDLNDPDRDLNMNGALLPGAQATLAGPTFEAWLATLPPVTAP